MSMLERAIPRVSWFELLYDVVIVASLTVATGSLVANPTWGQTGWVFETLLLLMALWLVTTLINNVSDRQAPWARGLILVQMMAVVVAALSLGNENGFPDWVGALALSGAFATVAVLYGLSARSTRAERPEIIAIAVSAAIAAFLMALGAILPTPDEGGPAWLLGALLLLSLIVMLAPLMTTLLARWLPSVLDREHLVERMGALVIIVLGETILGMVAKLEGKGYVPQWPYFILAFLTVYAIWRIYFTTIEPMGLPASAGRLRAWFLAHAVMLFGAVGSAAGLASITVMTSEKMKALTVDPWTPLSYIAIVLGFALLTWIVGARGVYVVVHLVAAVLLVPMYYVALAVAVGGAQVEFGLAAVVVIVDAFVIGILAKGATSVETAR